MNNATARNLISFPDPESIPTPKRKPKRAPGAPLKEADFRGLLPQGFYIREGVAVAWSRTIGGTLYRRSAVALDDPRYTTPQAMIDAAIEHRRAFLRNCEEHGGKYKEPVVVPTIKELFDEWYLTVPEDKKKYAARLVPFVAAYGHMRVDAFERTDAEAWVELRKAAISERGRKFKPGTVRVECAAIAAFFTRAQRDKRKLIASNPWKGTKLPKKGVKDRTLDQIEEGLILKELDDELQRAVSFILGTGLRLDEFTSLLPSDIKAGGQSAGRVFVRNGKGGKSRTVPVGPEVMAIVAEQLKSIADEPPAGGLLWRIAYQSFGRYLKLACERAGIPTVTPHDLRRTYGSRMAFKVSNPMVLMLLMGHSDIKTTMEHYVKVREGEIEAIVGAIDFRLTVTPHTTPRAGCTRLGTRKGMGGPNGGNTE